MRPISPQSAGLAAMILACSIWGLSGIYYKMLSDVPVLEVLSHRSLWSLVFFLGVLGLRGRLGELARAIGQPGILLRVIVAALLISANWCGFIYSVQVGHALEASLGYYIFPLVSVALSVLMFGDQLRPRQWLAVGMAGVAVALLIYGLSAGPWIALMLAGTFAGYGVVKKLSPLGPLVSTAAEVLVLLPLVLIWLTLSHRGVTETWTGQAGGVFGHDWRTSVLLILSGPLTGLPLMLFSFASKRISLASLGLTQYLNPTLQFLVAVLVFGEIFTPWHQVAFALIWAGLALYSYEGMRRVPPPPGP